MIPDRRAPCFGQTSAVRPRRCVTSGPPLIARRGGVSPTPRARRCGSGSPRLSVPPRFDVTTVAGNANCPRPRRCRPRARRLAVTWTTTPAKLPHADTGENFVQYSGIPCVRALSFVTPIA